MKQSEVAAVPEAPTVQELLLPDLQEALLNSERLEAYLDELRSSGATVIVAVKGDAQARPRSDVSLVTLCSELLAQTIHSAQLRYAFGGARWVDTLIRTSEGVRLVRISC